MLYRDIISLITETFTVNDMGDAIPADTKKQVYANKKSIRQSEFYQAAATGLRPELMFEVRTSDYNGQPKLEYESVTYNIIRTYDKNGEITELICQGTVI